MPDYAINELRVHGDAVAVASLIESVEGDGPFDFQRVCSQPRDIDIVRRDPLFISAAWESRWDRWGTSRNASGAERLMSDGGRTATFIFETAWNPPIALIRGLAARYPALAFQLSYFHDAAVGFGLWIDGSPLGALEEAPTTEARRLLANTTIQAGYDERMARDLDEDDAAG